MKPKILSSLILTVLIIAILPPLQAQPVKGPAVDKIVAIRVPIAQVPDAIKSGIIDLYIYSLRPAQAEQLKSIPEAKLFTAPAGLIDLILNPAPVAVEKLEGNLTATEAATRLNVPAAAIVGLRVEKNETTGKPYTIVELGAKPGKGINPFAFKQVRLAMNHIVDRETIINTILKGFGVPMYTFLSYYDPDYMTIVDIVEKYSDYFKYDPRLADQIISEVLTSVGAVKSEGKWLYDGKPITIKFIIRIEDERKDIGLMVSSELKRLGFDVSELLMTFADAIDIVYGTDPAELRWHIYTEGWGKGGIDKYDSGTIAQFGAPWVGYMPGWGEPTFWNYANSTIDDLTQRIYAAKYKDKKERDELYRKATEMIMQEGMRVWIATRLDTHVARTNVKGLTMDLGAGLRGIWNLREAYIEGKNELKVGHLWVWTAMSAWNTWGGFADVYSVDFMRATTDPAMWSHPFSGLPIPFRVTYVVQTAGPVGNLSVPTTALIWDAVNDKWVNVTPGTTAKSKVIFDMSKFVGAKFHNNITISMADIIGGIAYQFDLIYDPQRSKLEARLAANSKPWADTVKGFEFDLTNKRITVYVDYWHFEESYIASWASIGVANPVEIHQATFELALDRRAETKYVLYQRAGYQWFSLVYPDHVQKVKETLQRYLNNRTVFEIVNKYCNGLLTFEEWNNRIQADLAWINKYGNAWISQGPFMLTKLDKDAQVLELTAFRDPTYPFKPGDWCLGTPALTVITGLSVDSPIQGKIVPGSDATINVDVSGMPPLTVKYVLKDPEGKIIATGYAEKTGETKFAIKLPANFTSMLAAGARYTLTIVAASDTVALPDLKREVVETATVAEIINVQRAAFLKELESVSTAIEKVSTRLSTVETRVSELPERVSNLEARLGSLQTLLYAALALAALALIAALLALLRKPGKPQ
ncbi:MAG: ABC transporter substrate-binding protein [Thermofilum sp.]|nr:ABC transporter substrate-binding protein [Thermofilum sp.]